MFKKSTLLRILKNIVALGTAAALLTACVGYIAPAGGNWVPGHWRNGHWVPGHYAGAGPVWVPGHKGRFNQWIPGHWRQ